MLDTHGVLRGMLRPALESLGPIRLRFASQMSEWSQALEEAGEHEFLIADWDSAPGGGVGFVHGLRQRPSLARASLLLFTSTVTPEMEALMPLYRIAAFITKPFTVAQVAQIVTTEMARRVEPPRLDLLLTRAWRLLEDGAAPKALLVYQWLRTMHPDSLAALYGAGATLGAIGELQAGLALLEEVVFRSPLFLAAWNRMSDLAESDGDEIRARTFADRASALAPQASEVLLRQARSAQRDGRQDDAERLLRQAIKESPEHWAPAFELTELLLGQDRLYEAARLVDRVKPHHRGRIDLLNHLGVALRRRGHLAAARQTYALALAEEPDNPALLYNAAVAHALAGEPRRALEDLSRALRAAPQLEIAARFKAALEAGQTPTDAELDPR